MSKKMLFLILLLGLISMIIYFHTSRSLNSQAAANDVEHGKSVGKKEPKVLYWVDPMHPSYKSDKPGIAPDCGMQLTPVFADDPSAPVHADEDSIASNGTVRISGRKQQLINLRVVEVTQGVVGQNIRTVGTLQYDETKIVKIHPRIEGWVDRVFVDYTGRFVRRGQPLFSLYSPDLVATQQEYLLAVKAEKTLGESQFADVSSGAKSLRASAYQRLKLWDVSDAQIKQLEQTETPMTSITFYSPVSGFVLERNVFDKQRITYDTETYSIADLSTIWLMANVYEYEASSIQIGQDATMTLSYESGRGYHGKVTYIYPALENMTRTLKVRVEFPNSDFALKPDMYANVELKTGQSTGLLIPEEAVLDSGTRKFVFVQKSAGEFESREVETGARSGGNVEIKSGLSAGEKVVASGNFLIDSESQLKSSLESMVGESHKQRH